MDQQNWFYRHSNQQFGPVSRDEVIHQIGLGLLTAESYVWTEGMENWLPVGLTPELAAFLPAAPAQRPQSVTVFGILNIVFGSLSLMCFPAAFVVSSLSFLPQQETTSIVLPPQMEVFSHVQNGVGLVFALVSLISGIGLLKLKKWARQLAYGYGWVSIGWKILSLIISAILYASILKQVSSETAPIIIGSMCGWPIGLIYPILLVIFMRKPHVIEACRK